MLIPASSVISISSVSDRVWSFCVVTRLPPGGGSPRAIPAGLSGNQKAEDCEKASEFLENSKNGVIFAKRSSLHIVNLTRHLLFLVLETWKISNTEKPKSMPVLFFSAGGFYGFLCGLSRASGTITEFRPRFVCAGEYGGFLCGLSRASGTIMGFRPRFCLRGRIRWFSWRAFQGLGYDHGIPSAFCLRRGERFPKVDFWRRLRE
mgnify:CR=1 FL=1